MGIARVDRAAGEDELARHEGGLAAALAHQDLAHAVAAAQGDHRGGIAQGALVLRRLVVGCRLVLHLDPSPIGPGPG